MGSNDNKSSDAEVTSEWSLYICISPKEESKLAAIIRRENDLLIELWIRNDVHFIDSDNFKIPLEIWKDGIYLQDIDTNVWSKNVMKCYVEKI